MHRKSYERHEPADHRVPVENAGRRAGLPVRPERQKEVAVCVQRYTAQHVGQRGSVKNAEQSACQSEDSVKQRAPYAHVDMVAQLQADAAQDQQPKHDHQRQVKAAEGRCVKQRKSKIERAAAGQQPHLVPVPHRPNARKRGFALGFVSHQEQMQHADAEIESVEHHVADDHDCDEPKPDETHHCKTPIPSGRRGATSTFVPRSDGLSPRPQVRPQSLSLPDHH